MEHFGEPISKVEQTEIKLGISGDNIHTSNSSTAHSKEKWRLSTPDGSYAPRTIAQVAVGHAADPTRGAQYQGG